MKNYALEDRDFTSWVTLARMRDAIFKNRVKEFKKYNLSARQSSVLMVLNAIDESPTPAEVSQWVFREPHSI